MGSLEDDRAGSQEARRWLPFHELHLGPEGSECDGDAASGRSGERAQVVGSRSRRQERLAGQGAGAGEYPARGRMGVVKGVHGGLADAPCRTERAAVAASGLAGAVGGLVVGRGAKRVSATVSRSSTYETAEAG